MRKKLQCGNPDACSVVKVSGISSVYLDERTAQLVWWPTGRCLETQQSQFDMDIMCKY